MLDFEVLESFGTTDERLKEVLTAKKPENYDTLDKEKQEAIDKDIVYRKRFEDEFRTRLWEGINFSLRNYQIYAAVDLAWDGPPINKATYPLMLYAQGKLDIAQCAKSLANLRCKDQFVTKDEKGNVTGINLPKFVDMSVNLVRSIITRRLAAQENRFGNLYPHFKYESRSTSLVGQVRGEVMSQVADIMADGYGYKHHETQVQRDVFKYAHCVDFVRCAWEREEQYAKKVKPLELDDGKLELETVITKEGVAFVNSHPSRTAWDNGHPLSSINTDTGVEWLVFWDVTRKGDIDSNPDYWNKQDLTYSGALVDVFSAYALYFSQYYCSITIPPEALLSADPSAVNDRRNNIGYYAGTEKDAGVVVANYYRKLVPKDWGIGDYPFPVWVRFVTAGEDKAIAAEILPSRPAAYCGYNEDDNRQVCASLAHQLMQYQDHLTNLMGYLLLCIQSDNLKVMVLEIDGLSPEQLEAARSQLKGANYYAETLVVECSRKKMADLGVDMDKIVSLVQTRPSAAINIIFQAMAQLLSMVERLEAMSPQEQGQPAPREISATESNLIAGTTESVFSFISNSRDEYRAAQKIIVYESYMAKGNQQLRVPVLSRFSPAVIKAAGFEVVSEEALDAQGLPIVPEKAAKYTVIGTKQRLLHDYIFTSRDGAERSSNTQAASTLTQLLNVLKDPIILQGLGKEKLYEIINAIIRQSGSGLDVFLEVPEGEDDSFGPDQSQQMQEIIKQLTEIVERNSQDIQSIKGLLQPQGAAAPPTQAAA